MMMWHVSGQRLSALSAVMCLAFSYSSAASAETVLPTTEVTATRSLSGQHSALSDSTVISRESIEQASAKSVGERLAQEHGIEVLSNGGVQGNTSVFIRGANGGHTLVLLDGQRISSSTTGTASLNVIPLTGIERIEIVRGPASSLYGSDALGGVIQIITRQGEGAPLQMSGALGFGSNDTVKASAALFGEQNGWRYALDIGRSQSRGFSTLANTGNRNANPDRDGYNMDTVSGRLAYQWASDQELSATIYHSFLDAQYDGSRSYDDHIIQSVQAFSVQSRNRLSSTWVSQLRFGETEDENRADSTFPGLFQTRIQQLSWQNDWQLTPTQRLSLILERNQEKVASSAYVANAPRTRDTDAVTAIYHGQFGAHRLQASARLDHSSQYGDESTGSLAYGYDINSQWQLSASAATGFRAPTFNELYYPGYGQSAVRPEYSRNAEIGLKYRDERRQASVSVYRNRVTDLIVTQNPCAQAGYPYGCANNVNQAILEGISASFSQAWDKTRLNLSLDWQNPHDQKTGNWLPRRARQQAFARLEHRLGAWQLGAEWQGVSERYDDVANQKKMGGYGLVNLSANYDLSRQWQLQARWNNVGNKHYEHARDYAVAGSNVFFNLIYRP